MEKTHRKKRGKVLVRTALILVSILVLAQGITVLFYTANFSQRFSSVGSKWIVGFESFENLKRERAEFKSDKEQILCGYFYSKEDKTADYKAIIVLNHGYGGGGHSYYLSQIDYLAQNGYLIFAFDKTGTDESGGKSVKGLPQGIIDLEYALKFLRTQETVKSLPFMLYGHSWGGYAVCSSLEQEKDIVAAVSLSGFNQSQDMLIDQGIDLYGGFVKLLTPFMKLWDYTLFGKYAAMSSLTGLSETTAEVLLFHSDDDPMIGIENSFDLYQEQLGDRENLHFNRLQGRGHGVFAGDTPDKNNAEIYGLDLTVMSQIVAFYDETLEKIKGGNIA